MRIHMTGIGGIGMSALSRYYLLQGYIVSGSDSMYQEDLVSEGVVWIDPISDDFEADLHVYTEAVAPTDIQRVKAGQLAIPSLSYFEALGEISKNIPTIAVCGTHGKSTTTAMLGVSLQHESTLTIVGTKVKEFHGKNMWSSESPEYFIVEACEYRGNFLSLSPTYALFLNCDHDHMDAFPTKESYFSVFEQFLSKIPKHGAVFYNADDANVCEVISRLSVTCIPVSKKDILAVSLSVPGEHNQMNARFVTAVLASVFPHVDSRALDQLSQFTGTWRRFDRHGEVNGITLIDDYAHHPTEITATFQALREVYPDQRILCVFQPHQHSRTRTLFDEFVHSLVSLHTPVHIVDIYDVRDTDEDRKAVSSQSLASACAHIGGDVHAIGNYDQAVDHIVEIAHPGDVIVTMGAGPVNSIIPRLKSRLQR